MTTKGTSGCAATSSTRPLPWRGLHYDGNRTTYRGRRLHPQTGRGRITLDPLEMLARLPNQGDRPDKPRS